MPLRSGFKGETVQDFTLGIWQVDPLGRRLTHTQDQTRPPVRLSNKANGVLLTLVEAGGQVVTRDSLMDSVWPDVVVGEEVLTHAVAELRRALGDKPRRPSYIETVHKAGYRLLAPVTRGRGAERHCSADLAERHSAAGRGDERPNGHPSTSAAALPVAVPSVGTAIRFDQDRLSGTRESAGPSLRGNLLGHKRSIAVLPFADMTGDPALAQIGDGMVEDIITECARFHSLVVAARSASAAYRDRAVDPVEAGRDLEVDYLLRGSLRRLGPGLRINVQLVEVRTGAHLWAERFDRRLEEIFEVQDEIIGRIVATLSDQISCALLQEVRRRPLPDWQAYDHYMMARRYSQLPRTAEHVGRVLDFAQRAVAADPQFAPGYGMLANAYRWLAVLTDAGDAAKLRWAYQRARDCALKASELDPNDPETLRSLGWSYLACRNYAEAERFLARSHAMSPHDGDVAMSWTTALSYLGRPEEATELAQRTMQKTPEHPDYYLFDLGEALFFAGLDEKAVEFFERVPDDELDESIVVVIAALAHSGRRDAAQRHAAHYLEDLGKRWAGDPRAGAAERIAWEFEFRHVYSRPQDIARLRAGLCLAGLPI